MSVHHKPSNCLCDVALETALSHIIYATQESCEE
uniref:Uncharacterized protein n=1 Tax=Anguilla anguilla TaxID=7936 RepID=A0A0E9PY58_ANGAN